jgi:excisionase family DNA binding protein
MANEQVIERYRVYTRDEAAALMRMTAMEMDDLLQARGIAAIDTGHRQVYLGETLLRAMGADFSGRAEAKQPPREISAQVTYPTDQAAQLLHVSIRTLRRLARNGKVKPTRLRGRVVYEGQELLRFLREERA